MLSSLIWDVAFTINYCFHSVMAPSGCVTMQGLHMSVSDIENMEKISARDFVSSLSIESGDVKGENGYRVFVIDKFLERCGFSFFDLKESIESGDPHSNIEKFSWAGLDLLLIYNSESIYVISAARYEEFISALQCTIDEVCMYDKDKPLWCSQRKYYPLASVLFE